MSAVVEEVVCKPGEASEMPARSTAVTYATSPSLCVLEKLMHVQDQNVLINHRHPAAVAITIVAAEPFVLATRLFQLASAHQRTAPTLPPVELSIAWGAE